MVDRSSGLSERFEWLIRSLFTAQGFQVRAVPQSPSDNGRDRPDLTVASAESSAVVELKFYRSFRVNIGTLVRVAERLDRTRVVNNSTFGVLATMSRVDLYERDQLLKTFPQLRIYDYDVIAALCGASSDLAAEFDKLSREAFSFSPTPVPAVEAVNVPSIGGEPPEPPSPAKPGLPTRRGADLCNELRAVPPKVSKLFEDACFNAIEYLFGNDLVGLNRKPKSDTGMHEYDAVGKISSRHDFWNAIIRDYRARYIVFEFKNYKDEAAQTPVYTTEKYLFPIAMRGAAIMIARNGFSEGAMKAIRGALRESGKLILPLSEEDICTMLHLKDSDDDYMSVVASKLDNMLIALER